eukprot:15001153-Alexandrium_andersonii.AAC.1
MKSSKGLLSSSSSLIDGANRSLIADSPLLAVPVCSNTEDLRTIAELYDLSSQFDSCTTVEAIKETNDRLMNFLTALKSAREAWKASITQLKQAVKGFKDTVESAKAANKRCDAPSAIGSTKRRRASSIFDVALEK